MLLRLAVANLTVKINGPYLWAWPMSAQAALFGTFERTISEIPSVDGRVLLSLSGMLTVRSHDLDPAIAGPWPTGMRRVRPYLVTFVRRYKGNLCFPDRSCVAQLARATFPL